MTIVASLAVLSSSAFATKARMEALGQDNDKGSYFMMDSRNIFRNPSVLLHMGDHIVTEWGGPNGKSAPKAEGGFFSKAQGLHYGVYLGRVNNDASSTHAIDGNNDGDWGDPEDSIFLSEKNRVDLFLAGDMGIHWGVHLYHASAEDQGAEGLFGSAGDASLFKNGPKYNAMGIDGGMMMGDISAYVNLEVSQESVGARKGDGEGSKAADDTSFDPK